MGPATAIRTCLSKYADFSGRAPLGEFWWFAVFVFTLVLGSVAATGALRDVAIPEAGRGFLLTWLLSAALVLPVSAALVRRLHDTDRSGKWALLALVVFPGLPYLAALCVFEGTRGDNRFGPDPWGDGSDQPGPRPPEQREKSVAEWGFRQR